MTSTILIFSFITLPFSIYCARTSLLYANDVVMLNEMAISQPIINGALKLKVDGFLGDGSTGFAYEGNYKFKEHRRTNGHDEIVEINKTVAIKFVQNWREIQSMREHEMLTYLKAYQAPEVEKYGIPTAYYHGKWDNFTLIAVAKLDMDILAIANLEPLDVLILMRESIVQLKYIHSCGARHNDIKPANIMVRGHKSFLIDFNMSTKMKEDIAAGTLEYASRRLHLKQNRLAIDDFESYFYSICIVLGCRFQWFQPEHLTTNFDERFETMGALKLQTDEVLNCIDKTISDDVLKMVIREFANEIYANPPKAFPDYNRLYRLVSGEIEKLHAKNSTLLPIFSWLTVAQKVEAAHAIYSPPQLNIGDIAEPSSIDFATFVYPVVEPL